MKTLQTIEDLKPAPYNPRKLSESAASGLSKSIEDFGDVSGITWNSRTGHLVSGHQRVDQLKKLGAIWHDGALQIKRGDAVHKFAVRVVDWDEGKEKAANVSANNTHISGEFNHDLANLLDEIKLDIGAADFDDLKLDALLEDLPKPKVEVDEDEVPEPPKNPVAKLGDIWQLGGHRLLCGDSTKEGIWSGLMGNNLASLMITDPPYNVAYAGKTKEAMTIENDSMKDQEFRQFLVAAMGQALGAMSCGAAFYIWHAATEGDNFIGSIKDCGEKVRQCLVWVKQVMVMGRQDYQWKHEPCIYGWKSGSAHTWNADRSQTTVLEFDRPFSSQEHPTMKPVALFAYLMGNSSKENEYVIDPFLGSGTTIMAAEQLNRKCNGIELEPKFCDVIIERWENLTSAKAKRVS